MESFLYCLGSRVSASNVHAVFQMRGLKALRQLSMAAIRNVISMKITCWNLSIAYVCQLVVSLAFQRY